MAVLCDGAAAGGALHLSRPVVRPVAESDPRAFDELSEADLVDLAKHGHHEAFAALTRRFNQRLFRIARSVLCEDSEAEDALQEAYTRAFRNLHHFRGDARLLTWLTTITLNEARTRLRKKKRAEDLRTKALESEATFPSANERNPEAEAARKQARDLIERAIDALPRPFRVVFVMRDVEEFSVEETAASLSLTPATVNTRLYRARRMLRLALRDDLSALLEDPFPFLGERCKRLTESVIGRLAPAGGGRHTSSAM